MGAPEVSASLRSWMSAVGEIARAVNAAEPLDALLARVAEQACALIGFEYCAVMLADAPGEHLRVAGWSGLTSDYVALVSEGGSLLIHPSGPHGDSPAAQAFRDGRTVAVPDVARAVRFGRLRRLAPAQGYRALLAAPLRTSGSPAAAGLAGVVVAYSAAAREFTAPEVELIELLADQAALALETARLRGAQQAVIGELSRANAELRRGRAAQDWAEHQHRVLMQLVLADVGLAGLVTALAKTLGASVTVEDAEARLLACAPDHGYRPPPDAAARRRRPARTALDALARRYEVVQVPATREAGRPGADAVGHPPGRPSWVAPVVLGGQLVGRLWVTAPKVSPEPVERRLIERFALVVGLELLKQRHLVDVEARLSGDLIGDLLRPGGPAYPHGVLDRAAALGHDLTVPHLLAVLTLDPAGPAPRLTEHVRTAAADVRPLAGPYEDVHVLLLPAEGAEPMAVLGRVLAQVEAALPDRVVTLAAGPAVSGADDHATAYRVARGAARLRCGRGGLVDVRDLGLAGLLLENGTPEALRRFAQGLLRPVAAHDARRGGDLLPTLRAWLDSGCSTPATAKRLVVHANTVAYRLARIEQLTGRSLRRPDARLDLQLALTVRDIVRLDER